MSDVTTPAPVWEILIATLPERRALLERLLRTLLPQVESAAGAVSVAVWENSGHPPLGQLRSRMVDGAAKRNAAYVSHIDDDDLVSPDYVERILGALEHGPDQVGFIVQCYEDGRPQALAYHSLEHGRWLNLNSHYLRDISHVNPTRTEIAQRGQFHRAVRGQPEDRAWAQRLRTAGAVTTEIYLPHVMYHYLYSPAGSRARVRHIRPATRHDPIVHPLLTWERTS